jgi:hypothetical protein
VTVGVVALLNRRIMLWPIPTALRRSQTARHGTSSRACLSFQGYVTTQAQPSFASIGRRVQRIPEHHGCIGDYLAHENVMGKLCSGKLSLILIGRAALRSRTLRRILNLIVGNTQLISMLPFLFEASTERMASSAG